MKRSILIASIAASLLAAPSTRALEVTNLDSAPHRILFEVAGSQEIRTIEPGRTEYLPGQPNGFISLLTADQPKKAKGAVQSDGMIAGIIGNGRTSGIPAEGRDSFVIWPDGKIALQQRRRGGRYGGG